MTDLTKRLVDALEEALSDWDCGYEFDGCHPTITKARSLITEARTQGDGWIRVTPQTMPEKKHGRFLITDGRYVKASGWTPYYENLWGFNEAIDYFKVTHWQPLPSPPGGE